MSFININERQDSLKIEIYQSVGDARQEQEDTFVFVRMSEGILLAIADGHAGVTTASLVSSELPSIFKNELNLAFKKDPRARDVGFADAKLRSILRRTVNYLFTLAEDEVSGSTLTVAFIEQGNVRTVPKFTPSIRITTAQVGDSIFCLSKNSKHIALSKSHDVLSCKKDMAQIQEMFSKKYGRPCKFNGAYLYDAQSKNILALTRALGDKNFTLIRKPEIKTYVVAKNGTNCLLASDGILDHSSTTRKQQLKKYMNPMRQKRSLSQVGKGIQNRHDNITMIYCEFNRP